MSAKIRSFAGVFAGIVTGGLVVFLVESACQALWPAPPEIMDALTNQPDKLSELFDLMPLPAKLTVLLAWALGPTAGGFTAAKLSGDRRSGQAVGVVMLSFVLLNLMLLPHPWWMALFGVLLPLPAARIGGRLARRTCRDSTAGRI